MRIPVLVSVAIVLVGATVLGRAGEALKLDASGRFAEGELLVKFAGDPESAATKAHSSVGGKALRHFRACSWQRVNLPPGMTVEEGLVKYKNSADVLAVEPNYVVRVIEPVPAPPPHFDASSTENIGATAATPDDPMFPNQWGLARIQAPQTWTTTAGNTNVVVAILGDTGVNYRHEDLRANMWRNPGEIPGNAIDDNGNGYVDDIHGWDAVGEDGDPMDEAASGLPSSIRYHGPASAGIIGAVGNNGRGLAGVNWSVQLMAVRGPTTDNLNLIGGAWCWRRHNKTRHRLRARAPTTDRPDFRGFEWRWVYRLCQATPGGIPAIHPGGYSSVGCSSSSDMAALPFMPFGTPRCDSCSCPSPCCRCPSSWPFW